MLLWWRFTANCASAPPAPSCACRRRKAWQGVALLVQFMVQDRAAPIIIGLHDHERVSWQSGVRAAEAQKPLVRANNVGFSAFIDANGQILSSLIGHAGNGTMDIQPRSGATPYVRIAAWLSQ